MKKTGLQEHDFGDDRGQFGQNRSRGQLKRIDEDALRA
jgi:hypothetical protein